MISTYALGIGHNSLNGEPEAQANYQEIDAFGLPLNEETYARVLIQRHFSITHLAKSEVL